MATVTIDANEDFHQVKVNIKLTFTDVELKKEYLLKGSIKVFEGRTNPIATLQLNEIIIIPDKTSLYNLQQQFPSPAHGFQLRFESAHKLYSLV